MLVNGVLCGLLRVAVSAPCHDVASGQFSDILKRRLDKEPIANVGLIQVVCTLVAVFVFKLAEVAVLAASGEGAGLLDGCREGGRLVGLVKHFMLCSVVVFVASLLHLPFCMFLRWCQRKTTPDTQ